MAATRARPAPDPARPDPPRPAITRQLPARRTGRARRRAARLACAAALAAALAAPAACAAPREIVLYAPLDAEFTAPVLRRFSDATGLVVRAVSATGPTGAVGLAARLRAERAAPAADVWWSDEPAATLALVADGLLAAYAPPDAPPAAPWSTDPEGRWTALGGRARVLLLRTDRVPEGWRPTRLADLIDPATPLPGASIGLAAPTDPTAALHAAALFALAGPEAARGFYEALARRGVRSVAGDDAEVAAMVADGRLALGLTDSRAACAQLARRPEAPLALVAPDAAPDAPGTLVVPDTVAVVAGAPNPAGARRLVDFLSSAATVEALVGAGWLQVSARPAEGAAPQPCAGAADIRPYDLPLGAIAAQLPTARAALAAFPSR